MVAMKVKHQVTKRYTRRDVTYGNIANANPEIKETILRGVMDFMNSRWFRREAERNSKEYCKAFWKMNDLMKIMKEVA